MKRITMMSLIAATLLVVAGSSLAATTEGTSTPRIAHRQVKQEARIQQGVKSGELTKPEARNLRHDQRHIQRMKQRAKADGTVTPRERERLTAAQNHESRKIYRKKHNARTRS
jgi:biopolymer transport protein ExbB/TolQ